MTKDAKGAATKGNSLVRRLVTLIWRRDARALVQLERLQN